MITQNISTEQKIEMLIAAQNLNDYMFLVNQGIATKEEHQRLETALANSYLESYSKGAKALYEFKNSRKILRARGLEDPLRYIRIAKRENKSQISLAILNPYDRKIEINLNYEEVEHIAWDFIEQYACKDFSFGICIQDCPQVAWDNDFNCYSVVEIANKALIKYSGIDSSLKSLAELRGN